MRMVRDFSTVASLSSWITEPVINPVLIKDDRLLKDKSGPALMCAKVCKREWDYNYLSFHQ